MCGIVGAIGYPRACVAIAMETMVTRGPDDAGIWQSNQVIFGHRRLSILDLSAHGRQPMTDETGQVSITFNGEIYNFKELRRELERVFRFKSQTDTEVLIAGYLHWGFRELLNRIRGMFAFAIWDDRTQTLYLARDPFGKKPLFYSTVNQKLVFASTMNAMLEFFNSTPDINPTAIDDYLTYLAVPGEKSIFKGIHKLLPAHYAVYHQGELAIERYWKLSFANPLDITEQEALDELDKLVHQAVVRRQVSDVPIGCFLSGGVDSSLVTAVMAQESSSPITTLTMGFDDPDFDERPYARMVSEKYGTIQQESVLKPDMWQAIPHLVRQFGEPFADSSALPTYYIAEFARKHVTVVLNGDGGDELFAGYVRPLAESLAVPYRRLVSSVVRELIGNYVHTKEKLRPRVLNGVKHVLETGRTDARSAFVFDRALRSYRNELYSARFKSSLGNHHPDEWYRSVWDEADGPTSVDKALYGDLSTYLPDDLLPKMDAMTMAHSLEARSPLLEVDLATFTARIPASLKVQGMDTKMLLKKLALRYVPREVLFRPKKGFNMPVASWLRTVLKEPMKELLLGERAMSRGLFERDIVQRYVDAHVSGQRNFSQQIWSLMMLELWFQMYVDKTELNLGSFDEVVQL